MNIKIRFYKIIIAVVTLIFINSFLYSFNHASGIEKSNLKSNLIVTAFDKERDSGESSGNLDSGSGNYTRRRESRYGMGSNRNQRNETFSQDNPGSSNQLKGFIITGVILVIFIIAVMLVATGKRKNVS